MGEASIKPPDLVILVVIALATILCWSFWTGHRSVRLYFLSLVDLVGLLVATAAQLLGLQIVAEPANVAAIAFSFAGCSAGPALWREEIRKDLEKTARLYAPFAAADLLSWRGLLKVVDRLGARGAALVYVVPLLVGLAAVEATVSLSPLSTDRTPFLIGLAPVAAFAALSGWYLYAAARRYVPGA